MTNFIRWLQGERRGLGSQLEAPTKAQQVTALFLPSIVIPTLVLLADVSFYQEAIDFVKMKAAGITAVIIRAGQRSWLDVKFVVNWAAAKLAGLPRGSYWFYDSRETPEKQAALWWSLIKGDKGELFHVADLEERYGGSYGTKAHFKAFINEFQRLSGLPDNKIVVYTGFYWWQERVGNDTFFARFRLWLAWYSAMEVVRIPAPWTTSSLVLWQYTSAGDGIKYGVTSKEIDLNWYNGTPAQFALEFGTGSEPPPTGEPHMYKGTVITSGLRLRVSPNTSASIVLQFGVNDKVEADKVEAGWWHIVKRNGVVVTGFAYEGDTKGYIRTDEVGTPPPVETDVLAAIAAVKADIALLREAMTSLVGVHVNIVQTLNIISTAVGSIKSDTTALLQKPSEPPPPAETAYIYTGPRLVGDGIYEVIDVPSDPINQQWDGGAVPLFDDTGGNRIQIMEKHHDYFMSFLPGYRDLNEKETITTDENGNRFILGKAFKGQKLLIAVQGKSGGIWRGQVIGFDPDNNPQTGITNYEDCTPDNTPFLYHKVPSVLRYLPIMSGRKGNHWWIPMSWLKKVG